MKEIKKVTAIIGSARKKATFHAVQEFERNLKEFDKCIEFDYIFLYDTHLEFCKGCLACIGYGEKLCPLKDDRDMILNKLRQSDGVIFASPNFSFQVTAIFKNFLDRFSFVYHRPEFFGKTMTAIVTQGWRGGQEILKYLETMGENLGFTKSKGCVLTTLDPMTELQKKRLKIEIKKTASRFYEQLSGNNYPVPTLFRLMMFRIGRKYVQNIDQKFRDYHYYNEKGWFKSGYYYQVRIGFFKSLFGFLFDYLGVQLAKHI